MKRSYPIRLALIGLGVILIVALLSSCAEEDMDPIKYKIEGDWIYEVPEQSLRMTFSVEQHSGVLYVTNTYIDVAEIPTGQRDNCIAKINGAEPEGVSNIEFHARGTTAYEIQLYFNSNSYEAESDSFYVDVADFFLPGGIHLETKNYQLKRK
jgi:hypothetical protein